MMLFRRVSYPFKALQNKNFQRFSQNVPSSNHQEEQTKKTKHNPHGSKDLRGYEHVEEAKEVERNYTNLHSTQISRTSAYYAFSFLPNLVASFLGTFAVHPKTLVASDSLSLPKVYPDGVPVYDSIHKTSTAVIANKFFLLVNPPLIALFVPQPTLSLLLYGISFSVYYNFRRKYEKDIVLKIELLPNTEELVYQKINFFGSISTNRVKISDLEYLNFDESAGEQSETQKAVRGYLNRDVSFKIKGTGEKLLFDKNGVWHWEGINHPLLV